jgi:lysozyme family protein
VSTQSMTNHFDHAFEELLGNEGKYSNHPPDPETMWGITIHTARSHGYYGPMIDLPIEKAKQIYRSSYWLPVYDLIDYEIAFQMFDGGVNSGIPDTVEWVQQSVGVKVDGQFGPKTLAAILGSDVKTTIIKFNAYRLLYLAGLKLWPQFGKGWARRIANNLIRGVS